MHSAPLSSARIRTVMQLEELLFHFPVLLLKALKLFACRSRYKIQLLLMPWLQVVSVAACARFQFELD